MTDARDIVTTTRETYDRLFRSAQSYMLAGGLDLLGRAFLCADQAHAHQARSSGEPYVCHSLETALILTELRLDPAAIAAAILHDVIEDTGVTEEELGQSFGGEVASLVSGVTKLTSMGFDGLTTIDSLDGSLWQGRAKAQALQAENLRKLFLAMAEDVRVVMIKLADRLHNMKTLQALSPEQRGRIARETQEIYAPLAARLGIWQMKWQLEDLAFRYLEPIQYRRIGRSLASTRGERERYIGQVCDTLHSELEKAGIKSQVLGRPKHIFSIYRKTKKTGLDVTQLHDLLGLRVILEGSEADCYTALGIVHQTWMPIPTPTGESGFRDYIAMPKENGYRSLHTTVLGPDAKQLEVQIRTVEMHRDGEYGVAAHWRYKEGSKRDIRFEERIAWLRQLLDWQQEMAGSAQEFVESLKTDIFRDQVYVFTPRGELRELPAGSTPVDFAYRIHTDIGHRCNGAKVNGRLVPLDFTLRNGDVVEVGTSKLPKGPSRDWLNVHLGYVKTAHAREKIRQWFKRQERDENVIRGREALDKELARLGLSHTRLDDLPPLYKLDKLDDLLAAIGCGEINPQSVAVKAAGGDLLETEAIAPAPSPSEGRVASSIQVMGTDDLLARLARCCSPVPGDTIIGYITRGNGVTVHRGDCPNMRALTDRERLVDVQWGRGKEQLYPVPIRLEAWDRDGLLRDVAALVAEDRVNMSTVSAIAHPDRTATIRATLEISGIAKLSRILARLEQIKGVLSATRDTAGA